MKFIQLLLLSIILYRCVPLTPVSSSTPSKVLVFNDKDYEPSIGMSKLYPALRDEQAILEYPVISLNSSGLMLDFDLLEENYRPVAAKFIHCNADWSRSNLTDLQFLSTYNEFQINDYKYSENTRIPYVSYQTQLPSPTKSGNYLLVVYDQNNPDDILFTRRFMVYEQRANIGAQILQSSIVSKRDENHQIEFSVTYEGINNVNPLQDFQVVILQNHNWNMALRGLQPTLMRIDQRYLEYRHFNGENNFPSLNEFRFFDLRSIDFRGMNVSNIQKNTENVQVFINPDKPRKNQSYTQINRDLNGNFFLQNTDPTKAELQSEYVDVFFELKSERIDGNIFIGCLATNYNFNSDTQMHFNPETQSYQGKLQLRQGYYDYFYWVLSDTLPIYEIEGSFWQTVNSYEIMFYYRNPANNYDELIGYREILSRN